MDGKRPKIQKMLAFPDRTEGEPRRSAEGGSEPPVAKRVTEDPASTMQLMEEVCDRENLKKAVRRVVRNGGSPGVDGMTVEQLPDFLRTNWQPIRAELLAGTYRPQPVKRVEIPKPGGGARKLGIPNALDRFIQQAALQVLQVRWDPTFSEHSYGFRPGRSAHQAIAKAQEHVAKGFGIVVDIDLEKFFDQVNHDVLMSRVARRVADKRLLKLLRAFLNAGVMENGVVSATEEGTPQGGPLSPLLSNLLLDELDRELERRGLRFVRYADDCNIYVRSERAGFRVMASVTRFLTKRLRLKVNSEKSAVGRPVDRKFLGFRLSGRADRVKRSIAPASIARFKDRIRELTGRTRGRSLRRIVEELRPYLRGWRGYFGFCETPSVLHRLDGWVRRRLRAYVWKQWKNPRTRYRELRARGVPHYSAHGIAGSNRGPWRCSLTSAVSKALSPAYFCSLGLPRLAPPADA